MAPEVWPGMAQAVGQVFAPTVVGPNMAPAVGPGLALAKAPGLALAKAPGLAPAVESGVAPEVWPRISLAGGPGVAPDRLLGSHYLCFSLDIMLIMELLLTNNT